jgi:hypothetical protein
MHNKYKLYNPTQIIRKLRSAAQCRAVLNQDSTVTDVRLDLEVSTATKNCWQHL